MGGSVWKGEEGSDGSGKGEEELMGSGLKWMLSGKVRWRSRSISSRSFSLSSPALARVRRLE